MNKIIIIGLIVLVVIVLGIFFLISGREKSDDNGTGPSNGSGAYYVEEVKIEILKSGAGPEAQPGDQVTVHYTGQLENGEKFDSSLDRGEPFIFTLGAGQVIRGWDIGVEGMKQGEKRRLTIPSDFAYGDTGTPGGPIPPGATLIFEVELLKIQ